MTYRVKLRDGREFLMEFSEEQARELNESEGRFEYDGSYYNMKDVVSMEIDRSVPESEGYLEDKKIETQRRLSGVISDGFNEVEVKGYMEKLFDSMKEAGHFQNYSTYRDWATVHQK